MRRLFTAMLVPVAAIGLALSGCDGNISINGKEGVPLAELDTSGDPPTGLALLGPDTIVATEGDTLEIVTEGDQAAIDALRFVLEEGTLAIMRSGDAEKDIGTATVRITMPAADTVTILGSGKIDIARMTGKADINNGGSGSITVGSIDAETLDLNIGGSGSVTASGTVGTLDLNVAGSGNANLADAKVERADINVLGSGSTSFASDGTVEANIVGSGNVTVSGDAKCESNSMGAGKLNCGGSSAAPAQAEPEGST